MNIYILLEKTDQRCFTDMDCNGTAEDSSKIIAVSADREKLEKRKAELVADESKTRDTLDTDLTYYEIEEHYLPLPVEIAVEVKGGMVQNVYANQPSSIVDVEVYDLDVSDFPDADELDEEIDKIKDNPDWHHIW